MFIAISYKKILWGNEESSRYDGKMGGVKPAPSLTFRGIHFKSLKRIFNGVNNIITISFWFHHDDFITHFWYVSEPCDKWLSWFE
jgi:hypothetical protein